MRLSSRIAVTACATLAFGLVAFKAPAQVAITLGRSVAVTLPQGAPLPDTEAFAGFFQDVCHPVDGSNEASCEVGVRVQKSSEGPTTIHFDVWCEGLPASLSDAMRAEFPELANAEMTEQKLEGKLETSVAGMLGHEVLGFDVDLDQEDTEALRQQILREIGAHVQNGEVDVQIEGEGENRQIRVQVKETRIEGGDPELEEKTPQP